MRSYQPPLLKIDKLHKLGDVQRALSEIFNPPPARNTIIEWIEQGVLVGVQIGVGRNYYVYESSIDNFILKYQTQKLAA